MNTNEEFDELARRKLAERDFPYQEADWQAAQSLIDAERGKRKPWPWFLGAALLLVSGGLWYWTASTEKRSTQTALVQAQEVITPQQQATTAAAEHASAGNPVSQPDAPSVSRREEAAEPTQHPAPKVKAETIASSTQSPLPRPTAERRPEAAATTVSSPSRHVASPRTIPKEDHAAITTGKPETSTAKDQHVSESPISVSIERDAEDRPATEKAIAGETPKADPTQSTFTNPTQQQSTTSSGKSTTVPQEPTRPQETIAQLSPPETPAAAVSTPDSTSAGIVHPAPSDSSASILPPAAPPLVPERAPWEIGILGGLFDTRSRYTGGNSEAWSEHIHGGRSLAFGAEIMHMGRNIGLGTGLYYGSYTERMQAPAIDRSTMSIQEHWFFTAIDTTVLVITDTLPGNPASYLGTNVNTTIQVLMNSPDTVAGTQRVRDARDQVNRVSYVEIPLLIDAHLVQGRWSLGLRGGPTLGLLTGRRGAVPNATEDGYVNFTGQPFRELVPGYTARAYVRYRFNAAWSLGIEPGMRGLLSNSLGDGALERRNSALGVMMSLSYRLR